MRFLLLAIVTLAVLHLMPQRAAAQSFNIDDILDLINGGTGTGGTGGTGTVGPGTGTVPDVDQGDVDLEIPIPQQNIKPGSLRERAPGRMVGQGITNYRDRRANIRLVGPQTGIVSPDIPEQQTAMQALLIDVSDSFFGFITQATTAFNLLTQFNTGLGSGTDINQLLQQLTGQTSREFEPGTDIIIPKVVSDERAKTPSVVVPPTVTPAQ